MNKNCDGRRVDPPDFSSLKEPGDHYFAINPGDGETYIHAILPIEDREHAFVCLHVNVDRGWSWDRDVDRPTLAPSIAHKKVDGHDVNRDPILKVVWHGHLTSGRFEACADCP